MKIREITQKAENLIEQGENAKQRQVHYQQQANSARAQVMSAYARLEAAASETDEQGNSTGDVSGARAAVYAAQALLESAEAGLAEANRQLERVGRQKMDTVHEIERYEAVEEGNMSKLAELQRKRFGSNANAFMADLAARMNSGEQARQQLLHSMGLSASNKNYTTTSSGSHTYTSTASGDEKISNSEIDTGNTHSFSATQLSKYHSLRRLLHIAQLLDLRQKLTSVQALEMLMCEVDSEQTYGRARTHEEIIADMRKSVRDNWLNNFNADKWKNIVSEAQYKERLALYRKGLEQIVGENIIKNLSDSQLERLSVIQNTAFLEGHPLSPEDIIQYCKNQENSIITQTSSLFKHGPLPEKFKQDKVWNTEYMPLVKANIRQSVATYFSKYVSNDKLERCLDVLGFMDQAELQYRHSLEHGGELPYGTLGYNNGTSSNIAHDMKGKTSNGRVGEHKVSGSGGGDINYAFVTAVHENLHMMSANDSNGVIRRGIMVNDETSRAMNEAFTEYFTYLSCGGETHLGGLYPGRYSNYHILMQEMPILEKSIGRDCMMDAYFNNNPQIIRNKIDSILGSGAWDDMCSSSYDLLYNDNSNNAAGRLSNYFKLLKETTN